MCVCLFVSFFLKYPGVPGTITDHLSMKLLLLLLLLLLILDAGGAGFSGPRLTTKRPSLQRCEAVCVEASGHILNGCGGQDRAMNL